MIIKNEANFTYKYDRDNVEEEIMKALSEGPKPRGELVKITGIPRSSLYYYLYDMEDKGIIERVPEYSGKTPRWCVNRKTCEHFDRGKNVEPDSSTCWKCRDWGKEEGSPPLKETKGRSKILFKLLKSGEKK